MNTKQLLAILIAFVMSGTVSAQAPRANKAPKPMDVTKFQKETTHRVRPDNSVRSTRDYEVLLEEDFSLFTAGSEEEPDTTNVVIDVYGGDYHIDPAYTHTPGWVAYFVYQAGGVAYMGNWYYGFIETPEFEMAGSVHLSFRARLKAGTQTLTNVGICTNPENPQIIDHQQIHMTPEWQTYEFDFVNPSTSLAFIQINCYDEWFLDDFVVTRDLDFVPTPVALEADHYTMEGFDANWEEANGAEEYLLTVYKRDFYGPQQVYAEPEDFEGINNDGQWIDYENPNFPEGWRIDLQSGNHCHVTTEAHSGNVALCMDAEGDTIILPSNGGRFLTSNLGLRVLNFTEGNSSELQIIGKVNGEWHNTGTFYWAANTYSNHGDEWFTTDILSLWISNLYDEIGLAYMGEDVIWAIDDWDYTTSQACNIEYLLVDQVVEAPATSYTVTGLDPADDHYYYLKARNDEFGESGTSNYISCFGLCPPIVEEASNISENTYTANWQAHPKADAYEIHNYAIFTATSNAPGSVVFSEDFVLVHNGLDPQNYMTDPDPLQASPRRIHRPEGLERHRRHLGRTPVGRCRQRGLLGTGHHA